MTEKFTKGRNRSSDLIVRSKEKSEDAICYSALNWSLFYGGNKELYWYLSCSIDLLKEIIPWKREPNLEYLRYNCDMSLLWTYQQLGEYMSYSEETETIS